MPSGRTTTSEPGADRGPTEEMSRSRTIQELRDLIAALDRRVPQVQRAGETSIAVAAADLKARALRRIDDLERQAAPGAD